jgi:2-polyprenyl-3-methyl-5-hydroxy-6-metoxy-1,4-benzoquinol methylase
MKHIEHQVKSYYDNYNYPVVTLYTNKQRKHHLKLIKDILSYGSLSLNDLNGKRILDAGCGSGEKSILFSKYGGIVTGVDLSSGQINQ